jgi:hypothetical protein
MQLRVTRIMIAITIAHRDIDSCGKCEEDVFNSIPGLCDSHRDIEFLYPRSTVAGVIQGERATLPLLKPKPPAPPLSPISRQYNG